MVYSSSTNLVLLQPSCFTSQSDTLTMGDPTTANLAMASLCLDGMRHHAMSAMYFSYDGTVEAGLGVGIMCGRDDTPQHCGKWLVCPVVVPGKLKQPQVHVGGRVERPVGQEYHSLGRAGSHCGGGGGIISCRSESSKC